MEGSPLRGAVPAIGWARTRSPARATSSSGVAPTNPSTEKRWLAGYERRSWPSTAPARSGRSVTTSTARASTTLRASPAWMRRVVSATASHHSAGERSERSS